MKKITLSFYVCFVITSILSSCSNYYYSPNDGDLVALRKQHDGHISAASNLRVDVDKKVMNIQAGYSPINHLALTGSYFKTSEGDTNGRYGNGYFLNGAIGGYYFFPIQSNLFPIRKSNRTPKYPDLKMEKGILLDLYIGTGEGKVYNFYKEGGRSQFKFQKDYVQLGVHMFKKHWGLSYNIRRGWLNYSDGQVYNRLKIDESDLQKFQELTIDNSFDLTEHSFRLLVGITHCRYFFTITSVIETSELQDLGVENNNFSVGLILEIDEFFRKKINKEEEDVNVIF